MKPILMILLSVFALLSGQAQVRNVKIQAAGLTCSMCSNAVQKALKTIPEVTGIDTDLKTNLFILQLKEGASLDLDLIPRKVEEAGFSVGKMTVEVNFANVAIVPDQHVKVDGRVFHFLNVKKQTLDGWKEVTILDQKFVLAKQFKKVKQYSDMSCVQTGQAADCCTSGSAKPGDRVFHVTI